MPRPISRTALAALAAALLSAGTAAADRAAPVFAFQADRVTGPTETRTYHFHGQNGSQVTIRTGPSRLAFAIDARRDYAETLRELFDFRRLFRDFAAPRYPLHQHGEFLRLPDGQLLFLPYGHFHDHGHGPRYGTRPMPRGADLTVSGALAEVFDRLERR